jgi:hypothetical protein
MLQFFQYDLHEPRLQLPEQQSLPSRQDSPTSLHDCGQRSTRGCSGFCIELIMPAALNANFNETEQTPLFDFKEAGMEIVTEVSLPRKLDTWCAVPSTITVLSCALSPLFLTRRIRSPLSRTLAPESEKGLADFQ